jgi:hypothetical protein
MLFRAFGVLSWTVRAVWLESKIYTVARPALARPPPLSLGHACMVTSSYSLAYAPVYSFIYFQRPLFRLHRNLISFFGPVTVYIKIIIEL